MSDSKDQADSSMASEARTRDAFTQMEDPAPMDASGTRAGAGGRLSEVGARTRAYVESRKEAFGEERGALLSRIVTLEKRVTEAESKAQALTEQNDELVRRLDQLCEDIQDYHLLVEAQLEAQREREQGEERQGEGQQEGGGESQGSS